MANIYDMADTWNDSGTVFTAIKMNVTDTASDADSLLMDLQVGGTSQISASKGGEFRANSINLSGGSGGTSVGESLIFGVHHSINYELNSLTFRLNTKQVASFRAFSFKGLSLNSDSVVTWTSGADAVGTNDLFLYRDAADILAQRRGTNPQEFRLYNTYTNSTDYERGFMRWNSNVLEIGTEADGTGTDRNVTIKGSIVKFQDNAAGFVTIMDANTPKLTVQQSTGIKTVIDPLKYTMPESSTPPTGTANSAHIFAEDNGSGKTRLMVQFGTGAAQQIAIEP